jgi:hypothetical protein
MSRIRSSLLASVAVLCLLGGTRAADPINIAPLFGTASQNSTDFGGDASRAIDGDTNGDYGAGSVTHSAGDPNPFWEVLFASEYRMTKIVLWNRTDCCNWRLTNFRVSVIDSTSTEVFGIDQFTDGVGFPDTSVSGHEIPLPTIAKGNRVRIQLLGPNVPEGAFWLALAEVQVFARAVDFNVARRGTATQSSTDFGGDPSRAIDGSTNGTFGGGSVSHTVNGDPTPFWEVELDQTYSLSSIVLWNRTDCCAERLANFRVSVLDAGRATVTSGDYFTTPGTFPPAPSFQITLPPGTTGKFVRISLLGPSSPGVMLLSLAEVQVLQQGPLPTPAASFTALAVLLASTLLVAVWSLRTARGSLRQEGSPVRV